MHTWDDLFGVTFTFATLITSYIVTLIELFLNGEGRQTGARIEQGSEAGGLQQLVGCSIALAQAQAQAQQACLASQRAPSSQI